MATIRRRGDKYQVQVRRLGVGALSKSFHVLKDAEAWARQTEIQADRRDLPPDRLIEATCHCRNPLIGRIILFALETAMRRGEILNIQAGDIDAERHTLLIPTTKNGQPRIIPITTKALTLLHDVEGRTDNIFPISANAFRLSWERVNRRAKIQNLHFHDLRHEANSRFFEKGLSTPEVALISGRRDMRMLFRYAHASRESVLEKLEPPSPS